MSLTKEEYLNAYEIIDTLLHLMCGEERVDGYEPSMEEMVKSMEAFNSLIKEHFDNPPLKFEELKEDMWIWDNKYKTYYVIKKIGKGKSIFARYNRFVINEFTGELEDADCGWMSSFEENRFYRKEVTE